MGHSGQNFVGEEVNHFFSLGFQECRQTPDLPTGEHRFHASLAEHDTELIS